MKYHSAIIGAGSAGLTVAIGLAGLGKQVVVIEKNHVGGDCTNVGCIPSKLLIHLANDAKDLTTSEIFARVRAKRDELRDEEDHWLKSQENIKFIKGEAKFIAKDSLNVITETETITIKAENIIIASGSSPIIIPIKGLPIERTLTNENLFDLENLPKHIAIVGAGVIGCEMAFAFNKLGSEVSLIDLAPRILAPLEPEVAELILNRLESLGVKVYTAAKGKFYDQSSNNLVLDSNGNDITLEKVDKVLLAIGRRPNLDLDLEKAGIEYDRRGIPTNKVHETNMENIYAIGDVDYEPSSAFTHSANAQGRRLAQKLAFPYLPIGREPTYPSAVFTSPEVAQVGLTLAKLKQKYHEKLIKTERFELAKTDRAFTQDLKEGFILIHALRLTGRIVSATIVAPNASEMIPILSYAVNNKVSMYKLSDLVFPYPSLSEGMKKAADSFKFATLANLKNELGVYLRYRLAQAKNEELSG